jgi:hypothetical protein
MRRISSRATFFYKRIFPILWFGFLLLFVASGLAAGFSSGQFAPLPFFAIPILMMVFGYFLMKKLAFDLVDEALDAGDALVIRNKNQTERIPLSEITNVNYSQFANPPGSRCRCEIHAALDVTSVSALPYASCRFRRVPSLMS